MVSCSKPTKCKFHGTLILPPLQWSAGGSLTSPQDLTLIKISLCRASFTSCLKYEREEKGRKRAFTVCLQFILLICSRSFRNNCVFIIGLWWFWNRINIHPMHDNTEEGAQWTRSTTYDCGSGLDGDRCLALCSLEHSPAPTWTQPEHPARINEWGPNRVTFGNESKKEEQIDEYVCF